MNTRDALFFGVVAATAVLAYMDYEKGRNLAVLAGVILMVSFFTESY